MAFLAKQMVGNQLQSVKGALGDKEGGDDDEALQAEREHQQMLAELEQKRKEKHAKQEEEREEVRQSIRDKYGIKKKEPEEPLIQPDAEGRIGRKKKTPAELAAENNPEEDDDDEFTMPKSFDEIRSKVVTGVGQVSEKCTIQ